MSITGMDTVTRDESVGASAQPSARVGNAAIACTAIVVASFALLYREVIVKLVHDWATDDNYSHGFLIVPLSLFLAWERRTAASQPWLQTARDSRLR